VPFPIRPTPSPPLATPAEARPEEIIDAAQVVFGENGFAGPSWRTWPHRRREQGHSLSLLRLERITVPRDGAAKVVAGLTEAEEMVRVTTAQRELLASLIRGCTAHAQRSDGPHQRLVQAELSNFPSWPSSTSRK